MIDAGLADILLYRNIVQGGLLKAFGKEDLSGYFGYIVFFSSRFLPNMNEYPPPSRIFIAGEATSGATGQLAGFRPASRPLN